MYKQIVNEKRFTGIMEYIDFWNQLVLYIQGLTNCVHAYVRYSKSRMLPIAILDCFLQVCSLTFLFSFLSM